MSLIRHKLRSSLTSRLRSNSLDGRSTQKVGQVQQLAEHSPSAPNHLSSSVPLHLHSSVYQASGFSPYLRHSLHQQPAPLLPLSEGGLNQKRYQVLTEVVTTEISYVRALGQMLEFYKEPMQSVLSDAEVATIFSISELLYDFHLNLSEGLQERLRQWSDSSEVGAFFLEKAAFFRCYSAYVNNITLAVNTLFACEGKPDNIEFTRILRGQATDDGQPLQSLYSYLMMPIQRVPGFLLLLQQLRLSTPTEHVDYVPIQRVIDIVSESMVYIDNKRQQYESKVRLRALSMTVQRVPDGVSVLKPRRTFRVEAEMLLVNDEEKLVVVFLFSDALFITEAEPCSRKIAGRSKSSSSPSLSSSIPSSSSDSGSLTSAIRRRSTSSIIPTKYNYLGSVNLEDSSEITVKTYVDGVVCILTGARETPIVLRHPSNRLPADISSSDGITSDRAPKSISSYWPSSASYILLAELCGILGIETPEPLPLDPSIFESLAPIEAVRRRRRRRGSWRQALVAAHSPSRKSNLIGLVDPELLFSADLKQKACSEPKLYLDAHLYCSATLPRTPAGQLAYHALAYRTLAEAGFIPLGAVALPDLPLSWQDVGYVGESNDFVSFVPGFYYELGTCRVRSELTLPPFFMFPDYEIPFYEVNLVGKEHTHMFGCTPDRTDWFIASIELDPPPEHAKCRRIVLRSKYGEHRFLMPVSSGNPTSKSFGARLERECPELLPKDLKWVHKAPFSPVQQTLSPRERARPTLTERLIDYDREQRDVVFKLKIGVVPTRPGDMVSGSDRRIFNNSEPSPDFQEFLDFLGEVVVLKDYAGFAGGLDTANELTGTTSLTTSFASAVAHFEIMFHVSTMLPHKEFDEQQLAKKRFVGNDIVVVVFHEDHQPFDPTVFVSKMNQAFIVVKKSGVNPEGVPTYRLAFVCKQQAPSFPVFPEGAEFLADRNFHRFLIAKVINAEATTHQSCPTFVARNIRARRSALQEIATLY